MLGFFRENRSLIWIIGGLAMAGLVLSMVGTGVTMGTLGSGLGQNTAAMVDSEKISVQELMMQVNRQREQMSASMEQYLGPDASKNRDFVNQLLRAQLRPDRVLSDMVNRKLFVVTAEANGAVAAPAAVRKTLGEIPAFQKNGKFDVLTYKQVLTANGLTPGGFEKDVKDQVLVQWFQDAFMSSLSSVSDAERRSLEEATKTYVFETLTIDPATFSEPKTVSEDKVQEFLANKDSLSKIEQYYNSNRAEYEKPEQIRASHILVKAEDGEKKIKEIREQIASGKVSFAEAAKKFSTDASNANKGGDLGFFPRGVMDPAFETAAFALTTENKLSQPVKSSFGWHLIELAARQAPEKRSLESVKHEIGRKLALEDARNTNAKAWAKTYLDKGVAPSESEAKAAGLAWKTQTGWSPMDPRLGDLGSIESHMNDVLSLSADNAFLKKALPFGNRLVLLKLKSASVPPRDPNAPVGLDKAGEAFSFYFEELRKTKEASKDIKISQQALQAVEAQLQQAGL
ncbi:MAG TPA: SurA N-terminal domain-containing protein [Bdellovibrionota bacterium]|jgi:peptidyl-prolyl cis-trans isomerase D|nr:SurA N-terminal domain-containing protein [Bdellovibrionota bacterium]